ncbi:WD40/YVTN/BNR-like repeat-containing protein [Streptomyces sp. NPDC001661]
MSPRPPVREDAHPGGRAAARILDRTHRLPGPRRDGDRGRLRQRRLGARRGDFHALEYAHDTVYGYDSTHGLLRTSKDGAAWTDGAELQALDVTVSPEDRDLVLATTADGVARSTDGGSTWKMAGTAPGGQPQALTAVGADRVLVATQDGVHESKDGGKTFTKRLAVESTGGH